MCQNFLGVFSRGEFGIKLNRMVWLVGTHAGGLATSTLVCHSFTSMQKRQMQKSIDVHAQLMCVLSQQEGRTFQELTNHKHPGILNRFNESLSLRNRPNSAQWKFDAKKRKILCLKLYLSCLCSVIQYVQT
jgi:hypothetical protein